MIFQYSRWAVGLLLGVVWITGSGDSIAGAEGKQPFGPGEKLKYAVRWRMIPAGEAELTIGTDSLPSHWKVSAKANSSGYVSNLYKVEDEYISIFHNSTFCSTGIRKVINEGDRHREVTVQFDQRRQRALLRDKDAIENTTPKQEQFTIPNCVHDILSALYYARTRPLEVGQTFEFPLNDGSSTIQIRAEVQAIEEVQTEIGKFKAIRVEPDVFSGNLFKGKGRLFVWFTNDADRIPVQLKAQTDLGTITASLVEVEQEDLH
ncbi:MAG: DUF3108 domain-containing protein [Acidobacteria bacterium]|nr:DUF3108 domain-containing protein [Acidobacteriota bacterium]